MLLEKTFRVTADPNEEGQGQTLISFSRPQKIVRVMLMPSEGEVGNPFLALVGDNNGLEEVYFEENSAYGVYIWGMPVNMEAPPTPYFILARQSVLYMGNSPYDEFFYDMILTIEK